MFGKKRNKIEEQINNAFAEISQHKDEFETKVSSIEDNGKQIHEGVCQVLENTLEIADHAMQNVEEESAVIHTMDECSKEFSVAFNDYEQIAKMIKEHCETVTNLVEENKHYTTPSKYLTEAPIRLKQEYLAYESKAEELADGARQMSVKAVNAAVEAGRMGNAGKQFVAVAEELRQNALDYEKAALTMKDELQTSQERIQELEEFILRLVSLIKDGNVSTTRLMKKSMELNKKVSNCSMRDFSESMLVMRDKVIAMRNLDEEVVKLSERNKIQLSDIQEEQQNEKQVLRELESDLAYILDEAQNKIRK